MMLSNLGVIHLMILLVELNSGSCSWLRPATQCTPNNSIALTGHYGEYFVEKEFKLKEGTLNYMLHLQSFLSVLRRYNEEVSDIVTQINDKERYLENAMNLFSLLKRSDKVWKIITKIVYSLPGSFNPSRNVFQNDHFAKAKQYLDKHAMMSSGYRGLSRLQQVYHVTADTLANGKMDGALSHTIVTAEDCYEFALFYYKKSQNARCIEWLEEAMKKMGTDESSKASKRNVLELYFVSKCIEGEVYNASKAYKELIKDNPSFTPSAHLLDIYNMIMKHGCKQVASVMEEEDRTRQLSVQRTDWDMFLFDEKEDVEEVDYGEYSTDELCNRQHVHKNVSRYLKCRYVTYNSPQLLIGPLKVEEFNLDPPVLMFHQVISDREIKEWMDYAKPKMIKSASLGRDGEEFYSTDSRTSLHLYIDPEEGFLPDRELDKRSQLVTGFHEHWAYPNQISVYGLAGEFRAHVDYLVKKVGDPYFADYSILMYYLNEVEAGGHTVFPFLQVSVRPVKGAAIMWFHRKASGKPEVRSMHAGCPVLHGTKWILKKRYHVKRQDFPKCTKDGDSSYKYYYL